MVKKEQKREEPPTLDHHQHLLKIANEVLPRFLDKKLEVRNIINVLCPSITIVLRQSYPEVLHATVIEAVKATVLSSLD